MYTDEKRKLKWKLARIIRLIAKLEDYKKRKESKGYVNTTK